MNTELKPCPFCGGPAIIVFKPKIYNSYREAGVWCRIGLGQKLMDDEHGLIPKLRATT